MAKWFFEWDRRKSDTNRRKHGIDFSVAMRVFEDPLRRMEIDGDEHGEIGGVLYFVSHTIREEEDEDGEIEFIRIISARRPTPRESRIYREAP